MTVLRAALVNRDLRRLELAWAWASLVRWALAILVALQAYELGGPAAVGVAALARMLPAALVAPRLSVTADRRSRRQVLLATLVLRLLLTILLAVLVWHDAPLWALLAAAGLYGMTESLHRPLQAALIGVHARNPSELAAGNTLWSVLDNAAFVTGSLLVGAVVGLAGVAEAVLACAVPLVLATATCLRLTPDAPPADREPHHRAAVLAGTRTILADRQLVLLVGVFTVDMFVQAVVDVLLVVAALGFLDLGRPGVGWLSAAWGVGGVLGGVAVTSLLFRRRLAAAMTTGMLLAGIPLVGIAIRPDAGLALVLMAVLGVGLGAVEVALLTLTQRLVAADVLARVYGAQETLMILAMAAGSLAASALVVLAGERGAMAVTGCLLPLLAVGLFRRLTRLDTGVTVPDDVFEVLRGVPAFEVLPVATVETLAVRSRRERIPAGEHVVRQGDPGESFFVIEDGRVEVTEDGRFRRFQQTGEFFGEIALLHDVPRSATVRSVSETRLLVLDQVEFLAAVGAHPHTRRVLHEVAAERLDGA